MTICLIIFALMVIGFFIKQLPMSFTSMAVLVALVLTGCVEAKTALGAFGSSTVVTMVSMFIVAAGLSRTQMINHLSKLLLKVTGGSFTKVLASYVVVTCILGQFIPSIVALFALKKPKPIPRANPKTRFACVIAARNEERVIGELVQSLLRQNYPKTLFDIYVMPNNCTDHTALAAIRTGAAILKPRGEVRCKGDALHEAFETLLRKDYDAFCVFDADNVVDADFLSRMNDAFLAGAKVTKGAMRVKNPQDSPLCGCYGLYFTCFDFFFSRARMNCGLSSKLVGTGFAVHRSVLEQSGGWNSATIAEDAEFAAYLAETGTRVWFVPEAVTYDEAPASVRVSLRQRRRWSSGIMDVAQARAGALARSAFAGGGMRALDMLAMLTQPFCQAAGFLLTCAFALSQTGWNRALALLPLGLLGGYLAMSAFALLLAAISKQKTALCAVFLFPLFMASWLPLNLVSLLFRTRVWKEIEHGKTVHPALPAASLRRVRSGISD